MSYEVVVRTYFSIQHIQSAILFAKLAKNLETDYSNKLSEIEPKDRSGISAQHFAFVTNAIFSSVCFLEATINELFCDAFDKNYNERLIPLGESTIDLMKDLWERGIPRTASYSVLEKYQIALVEANKSIFDIGSTPFQDIYLLIKLRNALMHFEPEAVSSLNIGKNKEHKFEKMFNGRFKQNTMVSKNSFPYFPNKCLGYGCAEWAVNKSIELADQFNEKMGLEPMYNHVIDRSIGY